MCKYCSLIIEVEILICRLCTLSGMVILSSMPWMNCVAGFYRLTTQFFPDGYRTM